MAAIKQDVGNCHDWLKREVLFVVYSDGGLIGTSVGDRSPICSGTLGRLEFTEGVFLKGRELALYDFRGAGDGIGEPILRSSWPNYLVAVLESVALDEHTAA
jgi:hypothetical protein